MRITYKLPIHGEHRQKVFFAWFPIRINSKTVVWLEKYIQNYTYYKSMYSNTGYWDEGCREFYKK